MHTGLWPESDLFQSQEVKSQLEGVRHEMTERARVQTWPLWALCSSELWPYASSLHLGLWQLLSPLGQAQEGWSGWHNG